MSDASKPTRSPGEAKGASGPTPVPGERLHKFLASTGAGSRRECETFIQQRRVTVNGKTVTKMGLKVDPATDVVTFDGERVKPQEKVYWILNKPPGTICTNSDERGRPRVVDLIPDSKNRIYTVGRLDADSQGLILLTNDGEIANVICHPRYRIEKVYQVAVRGRVSREQVAKVEAGVWLAEGKSSPARVRVLGRNPKRDETVLEMTVFEGRNREVRRVLARVGLNVRRLLRTQIGPIRLGRIPPGGSEKLAAGDLGFVGEAEQLYLANKEAWDAELPPEPKRKKGGRPFRPKAGGRGPRSGGAGRGRGPGGGGRGGFGGDRRGGGGYRGRRDGDGRGSRDGRTGEGQGARGRTPGRGPQRRSDDRPPPRGRRYYG